MASKKTAGHRRQRRELTVQLLLLVTLTIVFGIRLLRGQREDGNDDGGTIIEEPTAPAVSSAMADLYARLSNNTRHSLQYASTPQRRAWDFMLDHQNITDLEERKKTQMFALSTFYEALLGDPLRKKFVLDDRDVCDWWYPDPKVAYSKTRQCNAKGEVTGIEVTELDLSITDEELKDPGFAYLPDAFLPPELALLTSLRSIELIYNGIDAPLAQMMSPETTRLLAENCESLESINLWANKLWGTIPTELGLLTQLQFLSLSGQPLSGTIPSELGLMTNLTSLELPGFDLRQNSIPSELEWMVSSAILKLDGI